MNTGLQIHIILHDNDKGNSIVGDYDDAAGQLMMTMMMMVMMTMMTRIMMVVVVRMEQLMMTIMIAITKMRTSMIMS